MNTRTLLARRIVEHDLCPGTASFDEWLAAKWVRIRFGKWLVPVIPLWGLKKALIAHDVHHAVLGYATTLRGELEIATWELASGGCGWNVGFWFDRVVAVLLGLPFYPRVMWRAWCAGWGRQNLYGSGIDELLAADVDELRRRLQGDA